MSSESHIGRAIGGALALARFDRAGLEKFDFSIDGFWRSFNAIAVTLPVVLATAALTPEIMERLGELDQQVAESTSAYPDNVALYMVFETIGFLAGWAFFPVAMIWIARMLDLGGRYVPLIVAYNWSRVVTSYAVRLPLVLFGLGLIGAGLLSLLWFLMFLYLIAYRWFVIRTATEAGGGTAFGLVLFDILGTALVQGLIGQLYWLTDPGTAAAPGNT